MCRNIKRDWQQQGNTGLRLCKIVRLYPGAPGNPVERKSNLSKKKEKDKFLFSSGSPRGRSAWALGKKGNQRGSEVRLDCPRISGLVLFPPPIFINPEKDKS
jgi:hypothetical protein